MITRHSGRLTVLVSIAATLFFVAIAVVRVARADEWCGDDCTTACKQHDRWCAHGGTGGFGWKYAREVAFNFVCSELPDSGEPKELAWVHYEVYAECDPDCFLTSGLATTGAPVEDEVMYEDSDSFKTVCGSSS